MLGVNTRLPVLSLIIDPADLHDLDTHYLSRGQDWERRVHLTYITPDAHSGLYPGGRSAHSRQGTATAAQEIVLALFPQRVWQGQAGGIRCLARAMSALLTSWCWMPGGNQADKSLRWTLMESEITAQLTREAGGVAPQGQFVVLFINGQPWGIYNLRERLDRQLCATTTTTSRTPT